MEGSRSMIEVNVVNYGVEEPSEYKKNYWDNQFNNRFSAMPISQG